MQKIIYGKSLIYGIVMVLVIMLFIGCNTKKDEAKPSIPSVVVEKGKKPVPDVIIKALKDGNIRFAEGKAVHPNSGPDRVKLSGSENQKDYAFATVLSCSDSRVPVEMVFDAGLMDLFIVRVAGNVSDGDEIGSIEYGLGHVKTPVLVVLGHTQCGAVTAVTNEVNGHGHELERNIPELVDNIIPAVKRAMSQHPKAKDNALISIAIEENVWQSMEDLFIKSPAVRELVKSGKVKVVGGIYDVRSGKIQWLSEEKPKEILIAAEASPKAVKEAITKKKDGKH